MKARTSLLRYHLDERALGCIASSEIKAKFLRNAADDILYVISWKGVALTAVTLADLRDAALLLRVTQFGEVFSNLLAKPFQLCHTITPCGFLSNAAAANPFRNGCDRGSRIRRWAGADPKSLHDRC
ncbi:hypothetical protein [Novosphingobium kaempferiae]|uniref:hypothetical protein n=1 Tax=Novosphingobium kaempferiae TaxID=2896849 RepID=UPI001E5AC8B9|nr:hypothetical protein [Novosphingobium kaempferiae]